MKQIKWLFIAFILSISASAQNPLIDECSVPARFRRTTMMADAPGTVELVRGSGNHGWTGPISVTLETSDCCSGTIFNPSNCGKFRWYCKSKGESNSYPEQSRCDHLESLISAKLGEDRLVNFNCLGDRFKPPTCKNTNSSRRNPCRPQGITVQSARHLRKRQQM